MRKFTLFAIAALLSVVAFAQKQVSAPTLGGVKAIETLSPIVKQGFTPTAGALKAPQRSSTTKAKAPRKAASDFVIITEQPDGELKTFTRSGQYLYVNSSSNLSIGTQSGSVNIVFGEDNTIYIQNPLMGTTYNSWVRGTYENGKVTIPVPQNLYYVAQYDACIALIPINNYSTADESTTEITYTVTQSDGKMVLTLDGFTSYNRTLGAYWTDDKSLQVRGEYNTVFTEYVFTEPELVTPPAGLVTEELPISATLYTSSAESAYTGTVNVGYDGNTIYSQGLDTTLPDAWVQGTRSGNTVTVPVQYLGSASDGVHYFTGYSSGIAAATFTYDPDENTYEAGGLILINGSETSLNFKYYYANLFIGERPDPVTPPISLVTEEWTFNASAYDGEAWGSFNNTHARLGFVGNNVYLTGFTDVVEDAWVEGTKNADGSLTFASGQFLGFSEDGNPVYFCGYDDSNDAFGVDVVFQFDNAATYTTNQYIFINSKKAAMSFLYYYSAGSTISQEVDELVVAPAGLELTEYKLTYKSAATAADRDTKASVQVGFVGNDVYVTNLWAGLPNAFIKGTISGNKVTFAAKQYLGYYNDTYPNVYFLPFDADQNILSELEFTYDPATKSFETEDNYAITISKTALTFFTRVYAPKFEIVPDVAATPANPSFYSVGTYNSRNGYAQIAVVIPTVDTDGNDLQTSKLSYQLFSDVEKTVEPIVFDAATYNLDADLSELPYDFADNVSFGNSSAGYKIVYLRSDNSSFNRIGVKSIYTGGGETHETEIQWYTIKPYTQYATIGAAGFATFSSSTAVTISGDDVAVYTVQVVDGAAKLTEVTNKRVPANTGVLLKGSGDVTAAYYSGTVRLSGTNDLRAATTDVTEDGIFILAQVDGKVGFYKKQGGTLAAGKAYLPASVVAAGVRSINFADDETTGIRSVVSSSTADGKVFNLQGQRVAQPSKGLYIVGGRKVVRK